MLNIFFGSVNSLTAPLEYVAHIDPWFDTWFNPDWMKDGWAKRVLKEIDDSELINPRSIYNRTLGDLGIKDISGGSKQLIMAKALPGVVYNGNNFGDNCWPLLLELSKTVAIQMDLFYHPKFNWVDGVEVRIINTGKIVHNFKEFRDAHFDADEYAYYEFGDINWPLKIVKGTFKHEYDLFADE